MTEIHELTEADGVTLRLARVKPQVLAVLRADGIIDRIGADHVHGNVHLAVEAQLADADR
jgi:SulP family sulfate permease